MLRHYLLGPLKWVLWFSILCALSSIAMSAAIQVSILKIISFLMGATAVLSAALLVGENDSKEDLFGWAFVIFSSLTVWNVALLPMDDSYRIHDGLFRGIFYHPQMTGIVSSLAFLLFLYELDRGFFSRLVTIVLAVCALAVLYESGSRTAALSIVTGLFIAVLASVTVSAGWKSDMLRLVRNYGLPVFLGGFILSGLFLAPSVADGVSSFVKKREGATIFEMAPETGRTQVVMAQLDNFLESPIFGHGFGVNVGAERKAVAIDPVTGLPFSAPTEKGLLLSAVLEEVGLIGFAAFLIMMLSLYLPILSGSSFILGWVAISAFMVNVGEATFFSFGGIGLLLWVVIGFVIRKSLDSSTRVTATMLSDQPVSSR